MQQHDIIPLQRYDTVYTLQLHVASLYIYTIGAVLISGVYDLLPVKKSYVNEPLQLTEYKHACTL